MNISSTAFIYVNVFIVAIFVLSCLSALKKGLILQALSLVYTLLSIVVAWILSPIISNRFPIIKIKNNIPNNNINGIANALIYFIIIFLLLKVIYWILVPLFKSVSKIPLIGSVNKIGGLLLGFVNGILIFIGLTYLLNMGFISNNKEIINGTLFKYGEPITKEVTKFAVNHIDFEKLKNDIEDFDADKARESLTTWLIDQGLLDE